MRREIDWPCAALSPGGSIGRHSSIGLSSLGRAKPLLVTYAPVHSECVITSTDTMRSICECSQPHQHMRITARSRAARSSHDDPTANTNTHVFTYTRSFIYVSTHHRHRDLDESRSSSKQRARGAAHVAQTIKPPISLLRAQDCASCEEIRGVLCTHIPHKIRTYTDQTQTHTHGDMYMCVCADTVPGFFISFGDCGNDMSYRGACGTSE